MNTNTKSFLRCRVQSTSDQPGGNRTGDFLRFILILVAVLTCSGLVAAAPPKVIEASPDNGATDIDPTLKEMRIVFDQDMNPRGVSVVSTGPTFPGAQGKMPKWQDARTCLTPIQLAPNREYKLSINSDRFRGFQNANSEPAEPYPIEFKTGDFKTPPPKVIEAIPDNGATDVDPGLKEIRVVFDQDMMRDSHSWVGGGPTYPGDPKKRVRWLDRRTCVLPVDLKPNKEYWISINSDKFQNFQSPVGQPAVPYPIAFKTGATRMQVPKTDATSKDQETAKVDSSLSQTSTIRGLEKGWSEERRLVTSPTIQWYYPALAAKGDLVFVAYAEGALKMLISRDGGKNWAEPMVLSGNLPINFSPAIAIVKDEVVVAWPSIVEMNQTRARQMFASRSADGGKTWTPPKQIAQSPNHCLSPRFLSIGSSALLVWQEIPLETTLGSVNLNERTDWSPDSIEAGLGKMELGDTQQSGLNVHVTVLSCFYNEADNAFTPPRRIKEVFAEKMPSIFQVYGPENGQFFLTLNKDTEIQTSISADQGQTWAEYFGGTQQFDSRMVVDVVSTAGGRRAVWSRRAPYQAVEINFREQLDEQTKILTVPYYLRTTPRLAISEDVYHIAWSAGESENSWISYMRTDSIRPTTQITAPSDPNVNEPQIRFAWTANDNISENAQLTYSHRINQNPWSSFAKEPYVVIETPPDGEYAFCIRAMDVAGNIQEPASEFKFNTFQAAPDTQILNKPDAPPTINTRSHSIEFTGKDNTQKPEELQYAVQLDDGEWSAFFPERTYEFAKLANGEHTLRVRSMDARENIDATPDETKVIVKVGLEVRFVEQPPAYTNQDEIPVSWEGLDDTGAQVAFNFFSKLDDGAPQTHGTEGKTVLKNIEEGKHTITIWAVDPAGNKTPEESAQFTVDRTPPETTAVFEYRWSESGGYPIVTLEGTDPAIGEDGQPKPIRFFQYHLGDERWQDAPLPAGKDWIVTKPLSFYSWGYNASVRAVDPAGNFDPTPAVVNLTILKRYTTLTLGIVGGVGGVVILFLLITLLRRRGSRRPVIPEAPSPLDAYASRTSEEPEETSSYGTSDYSFGESDRNGESNGRKKSDDPFDF